MNAIYISKIACRNIAALFFCVLLAACGGGGGSAPPTTYSITGTVSGATTAGVSISLTGAATATTTTDAGGNYSFASLANGSYTVTPSKNGYTFTPTNSVVSVSGADVSGKNFTATGQISATGKINGTGITASQCYQAGSNTLVACNSAGAIALSSTQDGMVGQGFSFTAVTGGCVQDNVTGLMWEVKTTDGGLRDWTKTYTNYTSTYNPNNLYGTSTDASGFATAVNASNLCGHNDWRLPTADELQSIVDYGVAYPGPAIDTSWFPNTQGHNTWASESGAGNGNFAYAWYVIFDAGNVGGYALLRSGSAYVRLVRAVQ